MDQCLESKAMTAWQSPARQQDTGPRQAASRPAGPGPCRCQALGPLQGIRSALRYLAQAARDLETLFLPLPTLSSRQPRAPARASVPQLRYDRKDGPAEADLRRNAPLLRGQVQAWLEAQRCGAPQAGPRIFCEGQPQQWTPLTAHLADLVVADCGPKLAQLARDVVSGAGRRIETAIHQVSPQDQERAVVIALANAIRNTPATVASDGHDPLLSPALVRFLGQVRSDVQVWTLQHGATQKEDAGLAGAHVVGNILFACGLRSVVAQLRREALSQPPTPSSRWIDGRGGAARASEANLYGWLETMCLDIGHGRNLLERYDVFVAADLGKKAHGAVKRFCAAIPSHHDKDLKHLQTPQPSPRLVIAGQRVIASQPPHPLGMASPQQPDSDHTPTSRSVSAHSDLSAEEFATRRGPSAHSCDAQDD